MSQWQNKPLIQLLKTFETGSRPSGGVNTVTDGIPSLGGEHLTKNGDFNFTSIRYVPEDFFNAMPRGHIQHGDILVVKDGATTGKTAFVSDKFPFERASINEHIFLLRANTNHILPKYLFFFLFCQWGQAQILSCYKGAAIGGISRDFATTVQVPLPPLIEQERVVQILDETEQLQLLRAESDKRTADLVRLIFLEMFGDPATNPYTWPMVLVGKLFDEHRNGAKCGPFGSALKKDEYVDSGIPVWGIPNVLPNQFVETGSLFISPSKFEELRAYAVESGDLLLSRAGTVGRICVARPKVKDSIIGTNLIRLALDRTRVVPEFFSTLMTYFAEHVGQLRSDSGEGAYSFMSTSILKTLQIYLPPVILQQDFACRFTAIRDLQAEQITGRSQLGDLFQSILQRAFQGEL